MKKLAILLFLLVALSESKVRAVFIRPVRAVETLTIYTKTPTQPAIDSVIIRAVETPTQGASEIEVTRIISIPTPSTPTPPAYP